MKDGRVIEIILTDEQQIFARETVEAETEAALVRILVERNRLADEATGGNVRWRRAVTYRDAGDHGHLPALAMRAGFGRDGLPFVSGDLPSW